MNTNPLGFGVTRKRNRYQAQISCAGHVRYLGSFPTPEQAATCAAGALALRNQLEQAEANRISIR